MKKSQPVGGTELRLDVADDLFMFPGDAVEGAPAIRSRMASAQITHRLL